MLATLWIPYSSYEVFLPTARKTTWQLAPRIWGRRAHGDFCPFHRRPEHQAGARHTHITPYFRQESTTHLRAGSYFIRLAKENYRTRSILPFLSHGYLGKHPWNGGGWLGIPLLKDHLHTRHVISVFHLSSDRIKLRAPSVSKAEGVGTEGPACPQRCVQAYMGGFCDPPVGQHDG